MSGLEELIPGHSHGLVMTKDFIPFLLSATEEFHQYRRQDVQVDIMGLAFQRLMFGMGNGFCEFFCSIEHERDCSSVHHKRGHRNLCGPLRGDPSLGT